MGSLATFGFWQWSRFGNSALRSSLSAMAFVAGFLTLASVTVTVYWISRKPGGLTLLYNSQHPYARRWGVVYDTFKEASIGFIIPFSFITLARSVIVGFGQENGLAQIVAICALEMVAFILIFVSQPYYSRGYNRVNWMIKMFSVIAGILTIPFAQEVGLTDNQANSLAILLIAMHSLLGFILIVLTILKLGWGLLWFKKRNPAFYRQKTQQ